jgi:hypothetical protein
MHTKILVRKPTRNRPLGDLRREERIVLKWTSERKGVMMWTEFIWFSGLKIRQEIY